MPQWVDDLHDELNRFDEVQKCKASPYYYATTYLLINGKRFTTLLTEDEFNEQFNSFLYPINSNQQPKP